MMGRLCRQSWGFFPSGAAAAEAGFPGHVPATSDPHIPQGAASVFSSFPPPLIPMQPPAVSHYILAHVPASSV